MSCGFICAEIRASGCVVLLSLSFSGDFLGISGDFVGSLKLEGPGAMMVFDFDDVGLRRGVGGGR